MTQGPDFTNPAQIAQRTITYDTDNMPVQVWTSQSGVMTYFSYDGDGDRVKKTIAGGATTYYVGDHYEVKNDESLKYIFAGNLRLIMIKGNNTFYYHKDHLNSTSVMTDNSGTVVETAQYEPFGATRDHTGQDMSGYKFTDQEMDNETNLYNYDARLYDPVIGRFMIPDPLMLDSPALKGKLIYDPQMFNKYSYCRNNPLLFTDPSGLIPSVEEAQEMAEHVYKGLPGERLQNGWIMESFYSNGSLQIGTYRREFTDDSIEYAVVNQGTTDWGDWKQNFLQPLGMSGDMKSAIKYAKNFVAKNEKSEITFVGHSKGGAESAVMAYATDRNAIIFNPATPSPEFYEIRRANHLVTAYVTNPEILNMAAGGAWARKSLWETKYLYPWYIDPIRNHFISTVRKAFRYSYVGN